VSLLFVSHVTSRMVAEAASSEIQDSQPNTLGVAPSSSNIEAEGVSLSADEFLRW